ncbi:thiamine phosphate synthase [Enterococcus dongliensis]|mgnify:CR=1 FL=1|uniref:Thiamine-phosphate synthase n=1 Tax=Enterococcus dongliensis TaxID=2559925 RepID=A0AAW8TEU8_9ENTE|nr:thiamine phosphate synthase [Enterococcus dongliensis]MDT2596742.1 thiamine phosphate synthase [Enterococcus dongliensis]MDT2604583.1 thiamine phosphate synthase [Enterococcus dongliensis]MDT2635129.1 thiamine phosphate synthase [Enterococcus dongliensis]MDT2636568.1 thiamine phosphate synthase [Enterococcus dongliensis]MDT2642224.1 thiamine phosphate synthase [Enterococcus dongliensis]
MGKIMDLSLYLVTGRYDFSDEKFLAVIEEACKNGVTLVQLREKELMTGKFYDLALQVKKITDYYHVPLIINDRVDICLAVDAAGVHIGDDEMPVNVVRTLIGPEKILGVSAKTVTRGVEAEKAGADYLGIGAIFPTKTKDTSLTSLDMLKAINAAVTIPSVAIGGITESNLLELAGSGIAGVSIVSEIMKAQNVGEKVRRLKQTINEVLEEAQ